MADQPTDLPADEAPAEVPPAEQPAAAKPQAVKPRSTKPKAATKATPTDEKPKATTANPRTTKPKAAKPEAAAVADEAPTTAEAATTAETAVLEPASDAAPAETAAPEAAETEVISPVSAPSADAAAQRTVVITTEEPPRRRRRWPWILTIVLVVLVVLGVVGFFVAERYVREYAENYTREQIISVLHLPEDTPVSVTLGEGSLILQALSGAIREVDVEAEGVTFGELTGDAEISATRVPLDSTQPVETLDIKVTIDEDNVRKLAGALSGLELKSIELEDGVIAIGTQFSLFNIVIIPLGVDLAPAAVDGAIAFDPVTIYVGQDPISVADLRNNPQFSAIAGDLLRTQTVCVASSLPEALTITDVDVVGSDLVVRVNGDGTPLGGPGLSTMGVCE